MVTQRSAVRTKGRHVLLQAAVIALSATRLAYADAPGTQAREREAKTACLSGHLETGIELLARLFAETGDATYIYNQGRCFEQNGRASEAVTRFREYLRKSPGLTPDEKSQVQGHITEMEQQLRAAPTPVPPPVPVAVAPAPAAAPMPTTSPTDAAPSADHPRALRIAGIATAAVGVAALAGGLVMGLRARSLSDEITADASDPINPTYSRSKYDSGQRAETLQWVGYGVGGAALLGGGLLYYLGTRSAAGEGPPSAPPSVTVVSGMSREGFWASLRAVF